MSDYLLSIFDRVSKQLASPFTAMYFIVWSGVRGLTRPHQRPPVDATCEGCRSKRTLEAFV